MTIFVSIASYRDPQLGPTIADCLAKARHPEELRFGVCWQHGPEEAPLPQWSDPRFRVLDVDWQASRGACWARAEIMKLWQGDEYFLQLDSHHRFVQDWDVKLLHHLEQTGSPKPILTAYATPFTPGDPDSFDSGALQMNFDKFTDEAIALFRPGMIEGGTDRETPVRARFLSAHFLFTLGEFVREVPYDPDLYFIGEEITLAIRAFTNGYDLFHPPEIIVWHEYTRNYRTKHWDDHVQASGVERAWHERDAESKEKIRRFLAEPWVGPLGCGSVRTFAEYEAYAGLSFQHRRVQEYTRQGFEPPNPPADDDWADRIRTYTPEIVLDPAELPAAARDDPQFWYVGFHDTEGREIYRLDASEQEIAELLDGNPSRICLRREFESDREPVSWTVWPVSHSEGWLRRIDGAVEQTTAPIVLVTALLDIGRGQLNGPFARPFDADDLPLFERLLEIDLPMVIYLDPRHADVVWRYRQPRNTRIVPLRAEDLKSFPYYRQVQEIRTRPGWLEQAPWLPQSPQAALQYYNPLVMSKLRWLADQARQKPFGAERLFWIDAGLCRTVGDRLLSDPRLGENLPAAAGDFLFIGFPYTGSSEIHGFPRGPLTRLSGVRSVDRVIRGGFFGGSTNAVGEIADLYDTLLASTLNAGYMGTEESVFTILSYRHPERFHCYMVEANGLVSPFFESLVEGTADRLMLGASAQPAGPDRFEAAGSLRRWPPGIVAEDRAVAEVGHTTFLGHRMLQNRNAIFAFEELTRHLEAQGTTPARIVELGTSFGGLSVYLQVYCLARGATFITYDRNGQAAETEIFKRLQIDLRVRDISHPFVVNEIAAEVQKPGLTLLLCDGPNKAREVNTFADYLKPGDVILAHDYGPSQAEFDEKLRGTLWSWCEITDADIAASAARNGLEPILPDILLPAVWGGWVKRGAEKRRTRSIGGQLASVGVYVLTFNAPEQFRLWLESAETAAPELLDGTRKVLLNNSTDTSTFAAYDTLCQTYGFSQFRQGNIGINGGRVWCARHFEEESGCDAMLYFEDDMLLHTGDGLCANGLPTRVPDLLERAREIVRNEDLDFLKLSFTELHGDHTENWAYFNMNEAERLEHFPNGPATRVEAIKSYRGLSYLTGDVFYSNWPMLVTRRGNRTMFLDGDNIPLYEQLLMVRAFKLARSGALRGGVLLASPINHQRVVHYPGSERREC